MLQTEFEQLTGKKVKAEEYAKVEQVYMAAPDTWNKEIFCRTYKAANQDARDLFADLTAQINLLTVKNQNLAYDLEYETEIKELRISELMEEKKVSGELVAERDT